ncbi:MAG: tRNA (guanosine(37)-N1)-methyltransferase TrmD [Nitrospirae bacterium]|nr:tRNA (guanosine(37)-N1)-methyltransferase TrmD [Nitrospirota bacterium]
MIFEVLTLFPEIIKSYINEGIIKRGIEKGAVTVNTTNIRDFSRDIHRTVDDYPYGGGAGMVMKVEPIYDALKNVQANGGKCYSILLSPKGVVYNQKKAVEFSGYSDRILLMCGRYEGVDERVRGFFDEEISIGDYILTGGELGALVIIDSVSRLLPGVLGNENSSVEDSFSDYLLDYPHYTRPSEFMGLKVPEVIMSGHHEQIRRWRRREALKNTIEKKPYLLKNVNLSDEDKQFIEENRRLKEVN